MQTISTRVILELTDEGTWREVARDSYQYDGPVALAKKGRGAQQQNTQFQQQQAGNYANNAGNAYNSANNFYNSELSLNPNGRMQHSPMSRRTSSRPPQKLQRRQDKNTRKPRVSATVSQR